MQTETSPQEERFPYRMKDLSRLTGLGRQAIHFYIQQGLLPPGHKTGRNMAYYGPEHLERLALIKRLQHERFLPLKAIKAILDDQQAAFSEKQRGFLLGVKQHMARAITEGAGATVRVDEVLERHDVAQKDFERMVELELIGARMDDDGHEVIAADDAWLVELWAEVNRLGFVRELGFTMDDMLLYDEVVNQLFIRETQLIASRLPEVEPERAAAMIERVLPIVHRLVEGIHRAKIRNFLASLE
ncbi:MAG: MerR family transcriptional regulator [Sandaracinaceae bacterium]